MNRNIYILLLISLLSTSIYAVDVNSTKPLIESKLSTKIEIKDSNSTIKKTTLMERLLPKTISIKKKFIEKRHLIRKTLMPHNAPVPCEANSESFDMCKGKSQKGEKIFIKYLKKPCKTTPYKFATTYTQDEWEEIAESGRFRQTIFKICHNIRDIYKDVWSPHLYQFAYENASDS